MIERDQTESIELLTFQLGDQEYSLDIMSVREIRGWTRTTPLPHAPSYIRGVINLRGTILPVMNLAERLALKNSNHTHRNVIIVVSLGDAMTGLMVDAVSDIIAITSNDLQTPPEVQPNSGKSVVSALTLKDDRMLRILDLGAIVNFEKVNAA